MLWFAVWFLFSLISFLFFIGVNFRSLLLYGGTQLQKGRGLDSRHFPFLPLAGGKILWNPGSSEADLPFLKRLVLLSPIGWLACIIFVVSIASCSLGFAHYLPLLGFLLDFQSFEKASATLEE